MAELIPIEKALEKWCIISIDHFQEALVKLNVGEVDGALMKSFLYEVSKSDNDGFRVLIKFLKYGRFVDIGVGRGSPLSKQTRQPKKWYGKTKTKEVAILRFIMAKNYTMLSVSKLESALKSIDNLPAAA
jgi:hypothetical protein